MTKSYKKRHSIETILGEENKPFIVMNDNAMVFSGLKGGEAQFSHIFEEAKPLLRDSQFNTLQRISYCKIYQEYI